MIYLRSMRVGGELGAYPFNREQICTLDIAFSSPVTFLVGDNGSGKSTLLEALSRKLALPSIGNADAANDDTLSGLEPLSRAMKLSFSRKPRCGFFLRAEDFFGFTRRVASMQAEMRAELARVDVEYADRSQFTKDQARAAYASSLYELNRRYGLDPDARSHGEGFLHIFESRITAPGLYLLDEPETPLSPLRQLSLMRMLMDRSADCQFIIATHSPILMACPEATIFSFDECPVCEKEYGTLEHVTLTRDFLNRPARFIELLRRDDD